MNEKRRFKSMLMMLAVYAAFSLFTSFGPMLEVSKESNFAALMTVPAVHAATTNPSTASSGYFVQTFQYQGQLSSSVANKSTWKAPWPLRLIDIKCSIRDIDLTTTDETYTFTLQEGAGTVATCAPTADATEVTGTISDAAVADEAVLTIDYAGGGTTPLADDVTIILVWKRQ